MRRRPGQGDAGFVAEARRVRMIVGADSGPSPEDAHLRSLLRRSIATLSISGLACHRRARNSAAGDA
jgi:hypothetical protein